MSLTKYPRTAHLPWSPGATSDDKRITSVQHFVGHEVVVTEKMDGENTTIYHGGKYHARSLDSKSHPSRTRVAALAARIANDIPEGWRVCGENCFAAHSISYSSLPEHFLVFGIYDENNNALSWDETEEWAELLGLQTVPVLYRGVWDEAAVKNCYLAASKCGGVQEGYVVRFSRSFPYNKFAQSVAKYVRKGHVQTDEHWMNTTMVENQLR